MENSESESLDLFKADSEINFDLSIPWDQRIKHLSEYWTGLGCSIIWLHELFSLCIRLEVNETCRMSCFCLPCIKGFSTEIVVHEIINGILVYVTSIKGYFSSISLKCWG